MGLVWMGAENIAPTSIAPHENGENNYWCRDKCAASSTNTEHLWNLKFHV